QPWGLAYGAGSLWVGNDEESSVARVDPATNAVVAHVAAGRRPIALAFGLGSLWVADYAAPRLLRIDPAGNRVGRRIALPGAHLDLLAGATGIWVTSEEGDVVRVDPRSGRTTARLRGGSDPTFVARCRGALWVTNFRGPLLWQVDAPSARIARRIAIG